MNIGAFALGVALTATVFNAFQSHDIERLSRQVSRLEQQTTGVRSPAPHTVPSAASRSRAVPLRPGKVQRHGTTLDWRALAECESSNNPSAISRSGTYRGLYQMNADFWATYGGLSYASSPENATVREQTAVAMRGYAARGRAPWPTCGSRL